jgi:membrane dipeptidase
VVLGTDFDGAVVPDVVGDVTGLPAFANVLLDRGYGAELVEQVTSRNWIRFLEKALPNA